MAKVFNFDGKKIVEPNAYSTVISEIKQPPIEASYGNIMIIDTGQGANYGGGAGIAGTLKSGMDAIQSYERINEFRNAVVGGYFWRLAQPLFQPNGFGFDGVSKVFFAKAAETLPAELSYAFTGGLALGDLDWSASVSGLTDTNVTAIAIDPNNGDVYVGTQNGEVFKSTDDGATWSDLSSTITALISGIVVDSAGDLYISTSGAYIYYYESATFNQLAGGVSLTEPNVNGIAIDGSDNVWLATNSGVWMYNGTVAAQQGYTNHSLSVAISGANVYVGSSSNGLHVSTNGGTTFTSISNGLPKVNPTQYDPARTVFIDSNSNILVGTDSSGVFKSTDSGLNFYSVNTGLPSIVGIKNFSESSTGILLVAGSYGVARSVDGGESWSTQNTGLASPYYSHTAFALVLSTDYALLADRVTGIYITDDDINGVGTLNGGTIVIQVRNEGLIGNGVEVSSVLTRGYAGVMRVSKRNSSKYVLDFYVGQYKGVDENSKVYDLIDEADTTPKLIISTPEFDNVQTLIDWMSEDSDFNNYFKLKTSATNGTGAVDADDLAAFSGNSLFAGGTETYSTTHLDTLLSYIGELDYSFVLAPDYGDEAQSADNGKILNHLIDDAKYDKFMIIGGGVDKNKFADGVTNSSIETAQFYDHEKAIVIHGGVKKNVQVGKLAVEYSAWYKAAAILGRICGLEPQVPVTFKEIDIDGELHILNEQERIEALQNGVCHTRFDGEGHIVNMGINSIQDNGEVVNSAGKSYLISYERIIAQVNKTLVINAYKQLLKDNPGPNRSTLNEVDTVEWTKGQLKAMTVEENSDNLLLAWQNISATFNGDAIEVYYEPAPNVEVNKIFFTGRVTTL